MASPFNIGGRSIRPDDLVGIIRDVLGRLEVVERVSAVAAVPTGDLSLVYTQTTAAQTWTINHNLGKYPSVTVVDTAGNQLLTSVKHISANQVLISFAGPINGTAYLN